MPKFFKKETMDLARVRLEQKHYVSYVAGQ